MTKEQEKKVENIVLGNADVDKDYVLNRETNLINDLGYTSLLMVQLINELEDEFDVEFEFYNADGSDISKYENLLKMVNSKLV